MTEVLSIPEPPPSACGSVKDGGIYLRGLGGGGWGGGSGGLYDKFRAVWPARADDTHEVTGTTKRSTVRTVDGTAIWRNAPEADWMIAQSRAAWLDKKWDENWQELFGMPWAERRDNGVLEDIKSLPEAQRALLALVVDEKDRNDLWRFAAHAVRVSVDTSAYDRALSVYNALKAGLPPFYVLARLHELLRTDHVPAEAQQAALKAMRYIAPADSGWMKIELSI